MSFETSAENYTVGKGQVFFNRKQDNGTFEGWRNLGNVVSLSTSVEIEKLDHYTTRSKYRNKDKSVIVEVNPKLSMTLDEINAENFAFLFLADVQEVDQAASLTDETKTIASAQIKPGYAIDLGAKFIDATSFKITDNGTAKTFVAGVDYLLNPASGLVHIYQNGAIDGKEDITATYKLEARKYKTLANFQRSSIEGEFRYVSDNAAGSNMEIVFWSVSFSPTGDTALLTDGAEWMQIELEGEIQGDNAGHPASPFGILTMVER